MMEYWEWGNIAIIRDPSQRPIFEVMPRGQTIPLMALLEKASPDR
jgi:hypothetical protein